MTNPSFSPALQIHARQIFLQLLDGNADEVSRLNCDGEEFRELVAERAGAAWRAAFAFVAEGDTFATKIAEELTTRVKNHELTPEQTAGLEHLQLDDRYLELRKRAHEKQVECNCPACEMRRKLEGLDLKSGVELSGEQAVEMLEKLAKGIADSIKGKSKKAPPAEATGDVAAEGTA